MRAAIVRVKYIISHAEELGVDPECYAVAGFSAGGHLAACFGTRSVGWARYGIPAPKAVFLGYPVVSMKEFGHSDSRANLLGAENVNDERLLKLYSVEEKITPDYPATFVWQCLKDATVPIENTRQLVTALRANGVRHIYEVFDSDAHGWGAGDDTLADGWVSRAVQLWQQ